MGCPSVGITKVLPALAYEIIGVCRMVSEAPVIVGDCVQGIGGIRVEVGVGIGYGSVQRCN